MSANTPEAGTVMDKSTVVSIELVWIITVSSVASFTRIYPSSFL